MVRPLSKMGACLPFPELALEPRMVVEVIGTVPPWLLSRRASS
jgi:hypothetical protein